MNRPISEGCEFIEVDYKAKCIELSGQLIQRQNELLKTTKERNGFQKGIAKIKLNNEKLTRDNTVTKLELGKLRLDYQAQNTIWYERMQKITSDKTFFEEESNNKTIRIVELERKFLELKQK